MLNRKKPPEFSTHILNRYLTNKKNLYSNNSRAEPTIVFIENFYFLWNFYLAIFKDNPVIKTIRGPFRPVGLCKKQI